MNPDFEELLRGYTSDQFAEALYNTLVNYLVFKNIIDINDYIKFSEEHANEVLKLIIDRDKEEDKKITEKWKRKEEKQI